MNSIFSGIYSLPPGGILADVMGLGKTLTMLSAIAASQHDAAVFQARPAIQGIPRSRATLIVGTSRRMKCLEFPRFLWKLTR